MNHALDQSRVKNSRESKASAYCRRNNINEYQFKKAVAWYIFVLAILNRDDSGK